MTLVWAGPKGHYIRYVAKSEVILILMRTSGQKKSRYLRFVAKADVVESEVYCIYIIYGIRICIIN